MSGHEIISITQEIINKNTPIILRKLGYSDQPDILRLKISESYDYATGICLAFYKDHDRNELKEVVVILYPSNIIWLKLLDWLRLPRLCMFSRKLFEKMVIQVLAHELRHFWQYYTGEYKKYSRLSRFLPRSMSLFEVDAENWAQEYLNVYGLCPRIASLSY